MALNAKQQRFCDEYLIDLNGTQAAIRAGYSPKTANEQASQLLAKLSTQEYISEKQKEISKNTGITVELVLNELKKIGFSNVQDYIEEGNSITDITTIDRDKAAAVSSIKKSTTVFGDEKTGGTKDVVEFKLWDKVSALEKLGKHLGMFKDQVDITSKGDKIGVDYTKFSNDTLQELKKAFLSAKGA